MVWFMKTADKEIIKKRAYLNIILGIYFLSSGISIPLFSFYLTEYTQLFLNSLKITSLLVAVFVFIPTLLLSKKITTKGLRKRLNGPKLRKWIITYGLLFVVVFVSGLVFKDLIGYIYGSFSLISFVLFSIALIFTSIKDIKYINNAKTRS